MSHFLPGKNNSQNYGHLKSLQFSRSYKVMVCQDTEIYHISENLSKGFDPETKKCSRYIFKLFFFFIYNYIIFIIIIIA